MATRNYDNFTKLPLDKMAQAISDMTYLYECTEVPKTHYKKQLEGIVEHALEQSVSNAILEVYLKTMKRIMEDSPKLFIQSLICLQLKINPTSMRPHDMIALENAWNYFNQYGKNNILNEQIIDVVKNTEVDSETIITAMISIG